MTVRAFVFPKLPTLKMWLDKLPKNSRFREPFGKEHGKPAEALLKLASQHLHFHVHRSLPKETELEKVSVSDMKNLGSAC